MKCRLLLIIVVASFFHADVAVGLQKWVPLLEIWNTASSISSLLNSKEKIGDEALAGLDRQIQMIKDRTFKPLEYSVEDYALSVGAIVGQGEGIEGQIDKVIRLGNSRRMEMHELNQIDTELASAEAAYRNVEHTAREVAQILSNVMKQGYTGLDALFGYPTASTWLALETELLPRLATRTSEVRRIRTELDRRRGQLHRHNKKIAKYLQDLQEHVQRIREVQRVESILDTPGGGDELSRKIEARAQRVAELSKAVSEGNKRARKEVSEIQRQQENEYKKYNVIGNIFSILQIALAGSTVVSGTSGASGVVKPDVGKPEIVIKIENTPYCYTPNIVVPHPPSMSPLP